MSAITAKASRKMKKYAVLTREPRCFLGSFDFSWEQRKLGEMGSVSMCRRIFKEQTSETGDIPFYKIGTFGADPDAFISRELFEEYKSKYPYPQKGDILISASGSIGRTVEFAGNNEYFQDSNIVWLNHDERLSNPFLKCFYSVVKWAGIEGSTIKRLYNDNILNTVICMPSVPEQKRIGLFFENLDNLITLHQRKCVFLFGFFQAFISMIFTASTFSWEQRKLGDMMNVTSVKRIHQSDWTDSGVRFLRARDIVAAAKNEEPDDYLYISKEKYEEYSALSGKVGVSDLLVTGVGTIGVPYLVRNLEPLYFKDGNIIWFQNSDKIDGKFLFYSFSAEQIQGFINESAGIGTVGTYTIESGKKTPISLPNQIEQAKVGELFQQLDNLITLHQRECISFTARAGRLILTANKKRNTSSWEQRKLGELVDRVVRKNINNESTLPLTISAQYGLVDQITYFNNRVASRDVSNYYLVLNGEFAYNKSTSDGYPFGAVKRLDLYEKGVLSTLYIVFAPKKEQQIDSDYLTVFFDTDRWHKGVAERAAEGARNHGLLNISAEDFFDIDLSVPKDIVEQKQIGAFIRQLDNLITLHQRKCVFLFGFFQAFISMIFTASTFSWEQRKLGDVVKEITRNDPESEAPIMMITANNGFIEQSERYAFNNAGESLKKYILLKKGELAYNHGASKLRPYGSCFALTTAENARIPFVYHCFSAENQNAEFMSIELNGAEIENQLRKIVSSGARMDGLLNISFDEYTSVSVILPGTEEQDRIADFFRHLDNLITLHQRKPFLMKWRTSDANRNQTNRLVL